MKVLLVEHRAQVSNAIRQVLESGGYEVVTAADGKSALERAGRAEFGLAIVETDMPDIDGYEIVRRLRESGFGGKFALLSDAICAPSRLNLIRDGGIADSLLTPMNPEYNPEAFLSKVRGAIEYG